MKTRSQATGEKPTTTTTATTTSGSRSHSTTASADTSKAMAARGMSEETTQADTASSDVRGMPKSGRIWKSPETTPFRASIASLKKSTWAEKQKKRQRDKLLKQQLDEIKAETERQRQLKRERRKEALRRKAENERKSQIVQKITNVRKLKRMTKKQMKMIEKR